MEKEIMGPGLDGGVNNADAEMYRELLQTISDLCDEAYDLLRLYDIKPKCATEIIEDYLEKIEDLIRV